MQFDKNFPRRFWTKVSVGRTIECWHWQGATVRGYGQIINGGSLVLAHRAAWEMEYGPIPAGLLILHKCDTPSCVNHGHLFLGTHKDNAQDASEKGRLSAARQKWAVDNPEKLARGSRHGQSKLTERDVLFIRAAVESGASQASMVQMYGISAMAINKLIHRKTWVHI